MKIKKTVDFFSHYTIDELLEVDKKGGTNEENLLFGHGENVVYFDNLEEYGFEKEEFEQWMSEYNYKVKQVFETINKRLAFVLITQ